MKKEKQPGVLRFKKTNVKQIKDEKERIKVRKTIAKLLAVHGYRNSPIEDIHAGSWPKNKKGQYASDDEVIVTTKDGGEIVSWKECSRIHDSEMKHLNKTIHNQIYTLLTMLETSNPNLTTGFTREYFFKMGLDWDEPKLLKDWMKVSK